MGEVRARDLHFFDFIKVCLCSIERVVVTRAPDIEVLTFRCNDYSENIGIASEWKALLLNKVVVGNGMKLIQDDESLTQLPPEYDSVSSFGPALPWVL